MDIENTFWLLDKHASEFNFPVLNNAYVDFGATRLTTFQSSRDWLIVFEVVGYSIREILFVNNIYAYGTCLELSGFIGEEIPFESSEAAPIFDSETNECVADWKNWEVKFQGQTLHFSPSKEEYAAAGVLIDQSPGPGTLTEPQLLRYLVYCLGDRLFLDEPALKKQFSACNDLVKFIQTTQWQHPDIARGERPSENVAIKTLVQALNKRDPNLFVPGIPNTDWKHWSHQQ